MEIPIIEGIVEAKDIFDEMTKDRTEDVVPTGLEVLERILGVNNGSTNHNSNR